jgi:hypothetical protein
LKNGENLDKPRGNGTIYRAELNDLKKTQKAEGVIQRMMYVARMGGLHNGIL